MRERANAHACVDDDGETTGTAPEHEDTPRVEMKSQSHRMERGLGGTGTTYALHKRIKRESMSVFALRFSFSACIKQASVFFFAFFGE